MSKLQVLLYFIYCNFIKGRELWAVKLTTATNLQGVPNIKIVGNVHGNEPVGREIILHLIEVLKSYSYTIMLKIKMQNTNILRGPNKTHIIINIYLYWF